MKSKLFYDMEVFKYDTLIVFRNSDGSIAGVFWNNRDRMAVSRESSGTTAIVRHRKSPQVLRAFLILSRTRS